ncbi:MAG TPA: hypothetical protein VM638_09220, partial [Actinomycetota bacterium]|nr:hypothetical protein [Actinomycetota bacterium]
VQELAHLVRAAGDTDLAGRLERAVTDNVKLLALTIPERAAILNVLDDPPDELAELRGVLMTDMLWRRDHGLE